LIGFGQHGSSDCFPARCFFGQVRYARSHSTCVALPGFGSNGLESLSFPLLTRGFGQGQLKLREARSSCPASVFGLLVCSSASLGSVPPNKSFKPTPHRGVNSVLCATLHAVATPLRGGLTPALAPTQPSVYTSAMSQPRPDFLSLSVAERIQLAEDIWDSIAAESPESMALTPDQLQAVQARLEEHEQDPASAVPWDQVRTELFQRNH
jgi:putative addiction module component (TIGR02574 family)